MTEERFDTAQAPTIDKPLERMTLIKQFAKIMVDAMAQANRLGGLH